jgi:hypothetical protein
MESRPGIALPAEAMLGVDTSLRVFGPARERLEAVEGPAPEAGVPGRISDVGIVDEGVPVPVAGEDSEVSTVGFSMGVIISIGLECAIFADVAAAMFKVFLGGRFSVARLVFSGLAGEATTGSCCDFLGVAKTGLGVGT